MSKPPLFELGTIVATPGAIELLNESSQAPCDFISRHVRGDDGDLSEEDRESNRRALEEGSRIFSVYRTASGRILWVITEGDRSSTCLLTPDDY